MDSMRGFLTKSYLQAELGVASVDDVEFSDAETALIRQYEAAEVAHIAAVQKNDSAQKAAAGEIADIARSCGKLRAEMPPDCNSGQPAEGDERDLGYLTELYIERAPGEAVGGRRRAKSRRRRTRTRTRSLRTRRRKR